VSVLFKHGWKFIELHPELSGQVMTHKKKKNRPIKNPMRTKFLTQIKFYMNVVMTA